MDYPPQIVQIVDGYALTNDGKLFWLDGAQMVRCVVKEQEPPADSQESFGGTE